MEVRPQHRPAEALGVVSSEVWLLPTAQGSGALTHSYRTEYIRTMVVITEGRAHPSGAARRRFFAGEDPGPSSATQLPVSGRRHKR